MILLSELKTSTCPRCKNGSIIRDWEVGEEICSKCGLVIDDSLVDQGQEWRAFNFTESQERSRTGLGLSYRLYDKGMSTVFSGNRDAYGKKLKEETRIKMGRLRRYDNRSKIDDTWRRNLSIAMAELDRISANLHISKNLKEKAAVLYRKALKMDLIRGRSIDAFVAACIYAACRLSKVPRPLKEITSASTREHSEIARTYRLILREMNLKMPIDDPMKFVPKIASKLKLEGEIENHAINILRRAKKLNGLSGKDPRGLAAAALYKASVENNEKRVQKEVARAAGTSEVTLRNRLVGLETLFQDSLIASNQD